MFKTIIVTIVLIEQILFMGLIPIKSFTKISKLINSIMLVSLTLLSLMNPNFSGAISFAYLSGYIFFYANTKNIIYSLLYTILLYISIQVSLIVSYDIVYIFTTGQISDLWFILASLINIAVFSLIAYMIHKLDDLLEFVNLSNKLSRNFRIYVYSFCGVFILIALLQAFHATPYDEIYWLYNIIITLLTIVFVSTAFYTYKITLYFDEINQLNNLYTSESKRIEEIRSFKHDYKNILMTLTIYLKENEVDNALQLLQDISSYSDEILSENALQELNKISILPIKSLVSLKFSQASSKGIHVNLKVTEDLININMNLLDFIRAFSIILDNAIEASLEAEQRPFIDIIIISKDDLTIAVENNYSSNSETTLLDLQKKGFTTKKNHSGMGLYFLSQLTKSYSNFKFTISRNKALFKAELLVENAERIS